MKTFRISGFLLAIAAGAFILASCASKTSQVTHTFAIGTNDFLLDGSRFQIRCGEIHAARVPKEYWRNRLKMATGFSRMLRAKAIPANSAERHEKLTPLGRC